MTKITCELCMDLMPLVQDRLASPDSVDAVQHHLEQCPACRAIFEDQAPAPLNGEKIVKKLQRKIQLFMGMLLMFGLFLGVSLTAGDQLFLNSLLMPAMGGIGYVLFRWKSYYLVPGLLFVMHVLMNLISWGLGNEYLPFVDILMWILIYAVFAMIGTTIVGLLYFVFRKEKTV